MPARTAEDGAATPGLPRTRTFLPEVQALRAVAVSLVVLYHFWPLRLPGGYVGVDVFFVISGFLITSHLQRELLRTGTISLRAFYARRARRLLPAALLVLLTTIAASLAFLPQPRWAATAHEVIASTFYVQNWFLAGRAVQYSASNDAASAVQHFWSLSVEEQFYLAWPSLILVLVLVQRRWWPRSRSGFVLPGIVAVTGLSLAYSVYATATDRAAAYFVTPTRIWELGVGAVLALWAGRRRSTALAYERPLRRPGMVALRWAGLLMVLASALTLSSASPFPGYLALLPVLGTAMVIAAGDAGQRDPLTRLFRLRPPQFLGAISYALYLWHWPILVIAPFVLGHPLGTRGKLLLVGASIGVAWVTKRLVEDPPQRWQPIVRRPALTAALTAAAMLVVFGAAGLELGRVAQLQTAARAQLADAQHDPCFAAAAMTAGGHPGCADPFRPPVSTVLTADDQYWFGDPACSATLVPVGRFDCRFSSQPPTRRVVLVGDSHAQQWIAGLHRIAKQFNWELVEYFQGGCAATDSQVVRFEGRPVNTAACHAWGQQVSEAVTEGHFDLVITSSFTTGYAFGSPSGDSAEAGARGFASMWSRWVAAGAQVVAIRDIPTTGGRNMPECLATHPADPLACASPRRTAVVPDPAMVAVSRDRSQHVHLADLTSSFCDASTCYAAIGGAQVYWDVDHLTRTYSRSLAPALYDAMRPALG